MKKITIISLLLIIFASANQLNAQILDSVYSDTNSVMKRARGFVFGLNNYDSDSNYWAAFNLNSYIIHDKDLNIIDTIMMDTIPRNNDYFDHKYNNKVYSISYSYENNKDTNIVYFSSYNLNTGAFISKQIPTAFNVFRCVETFTKNKEFAVLVSEKESELSSGDLINPMLIILDTLGNIVRSNYISGTFRYSPLIEIGDYFIFVNRALYQPAKIVLVDKNTLQVEDSIDGDFFGAKVVNDSILLGVFGAGFVDINIWNINSKERKTFKFVADTVTGAFAVGFRMEYVSLDSIYLAYLMYSFGDSPYENIQIVNFGLNGNFNFRYTFNALEKGKQNGICNIFPTKDGGLILDIFSCLPYGGDAYGSIIKFMPRQVDSLFASISDSPIINNITCIAYPNPAKDNISFNCSSMINNIDIFNIMGERVYRIDVKDKVKTIDISSLRKGMYIAKLYTKHGIIDKKFIVE